MIIPFFIPHAGCPHQCVFCNQKNITGQDRQPVLSLLHPKIEEYLAKKRPHESAQIAFYGGTFTALPLDVQKSYLEAAQPFIRSGRIEAIRISTRPDSISIPVLRLLNEHCVSVVELGAQSMNDQVLNLSGRGHTMADTEHAVSLLRKFPFIIGLQLMPGLPGDSRDRFLETVEKTIALRPDIVRLYPALVIRDTPLEGLFRTGRYVPLALEEAVDLCKQALLRFLNEGIDVIRIGLQPTEELEKPGTIVAGPFHPAFRQLVESSILLDRMRTVLSARKDPVQTARMAVHQEDVSNAVGQKRSNVEILKKEFGLKRIVVQADDSISRRTVRLVGT